MKALLLSERLLHSKPDLVSLSFRTCEPPSAHASVLGVLGSVENLILDECNSRSYVGVRSFLFIDHKVIKFVIQPQCVRMHFTSLESNIRFKGFTQYTIAENSKVGRHCKNWMIHGRNIYVQVSEQLCDMPAGPYFAVLQITPDRVETRLGLSTLCLPSISLLL